MRERTICLLQQKYAHVFGMSTPLQVTNNVGSKALEILVSLFSSELINTYFSI